MKKGWSLKTELIWLSVFVFCLIVAFIGIYRIGFLSSLNDILNPDYVNVKKIDKTVNGNYGSTTNKNTVKTSNDSTMSSSFSYKSLEDKLSESAKNYIAEVYNEDIGLDTLIIKVSRLKENGYLSNFYDKNSVPCSGYVSVYKENETIKYDPYIKCYSYTTSGYIERRDD